jgi:putative acetyltransferase
LGLSKDKIELLFVHGDHLGKKIGTILLNHAIGLGYSKLDCYDANKVAISFYQSKGFEIVGRDELDFFGKPFPLLHLILSNSN